LQAAGHEKEQSQALKPQHWHVLDEHE